MIKLDCNRNFRVKKTSLRIVLTASAALLPVFAAPCAAQASDSDQPASALDIVVTAQRRVERLQDVPVAVQVVQAEDLHAKNTNSLTDLSENLPQIHIVSAGNQFGNSLNIRGVGSGASNPAFDQSVATFIDDIYYGRSRMIQGVFLDMDRIEVLKGPQSTFFGNNAIAGALNMVTKKPGARSDGYARALYGSFGQYAFEAANTFHLGDTVGLRLAGTANGQRGWIRNVNTGELAPKTRNFAGRATLRWQPSDEFDATLKIEGSSNKIEGAYNQVPSQWTNCPPPAPLAINTINAQCGAAVAANIPMGLDNNLNSGLAGQFAKLETQADVLSMNYDLGWASLSSVTGYSWYKFTAHEDNAAVANQVLTTVGIAPEKYHQFSQELRLTSSEETRLQYMLGLYYQYDKTDELISGNAAFANALLQFVLQFPASALPLGYDVGYTQSEKVASAFGALTFKANDKLKVNLGLRGTSVHKDFVGTVQYGQRTGIYDGFVPYPAALNNLAGVILGAPGVYPYSRTDRALMGSAGLQYQIQPDIMAYATFSRGFKAGGFSATSPAPLTTIFNQTILPDFGPETVNMYEVGLKSTWFGGKLLLNVDVFREDYKDLQVNAAVQLGINAQIIPQNAASARSQGIELESKLQLSDNFSLSADVAYLDAKYRSFTNAPPTFLQTQQKIPSQDLSGRPLDFAPEWTGVISGEFKQPIGNYRLLIGSSAIFTSSYFNSAGTDDPVLHIGGSVRWDGKITFESPSQRWAIDVIGKNLGDRVIPLSLGSHTNPGGKEAPRSVAVQLRYSW